MTTYTPSQLPSVEWKPCIICDGELSSDKCYHCSGTGTEPVEMENPIVDQFYYGDEGDFETVYKCFHCGRAKVELMKIVEGME